MKNEERFPYEILKDPLVFKSENCLPAHSDNVVFGRAEEAGGESSLRRSLNGLWRFSWAANIDAAPKDFFRPGADLSAFGEIAVPGHMQMQGYGVPQYANYEYPWDGREDILPGEIPETFNPVGSYLRTFEIPEAWGGRPVFLRFEGVESGFALWVDGHLAGYSEDTFTPSEFEITEFLTAGSLEHTLALQVFTWTASSWLEDQDFFRFSGIFRDVWLFTKTAVYPEDLTVFAEPDEDYIGGTLRAHLSLSLTNAASAELVLDRLGEELFRRRVEIPAPSGAAVMETAASPAAPAVMETAASPAAPAVPEAAASPAAPAALEAAASPAAPAMVPATPVSETADGAGLHDGPSRTLLCFEEHLPSVELWSAERPALYRLTIILRDEKGRESACICQKTGFRRFELRDGLMCLNGQRIVFNGVNRHEFSAKTGRVVTREQVLDDILIMKRNNINAVRTSHYQNAPYIYELCDEYGLYMIAENNLETHGTWGGVGGGMYPPGTELPRDHMEYLPMLRDRITSTCELDKNHPSVLIWSLGNESFGGRVLSEMADFVRENFPGRLIHYEGIFHDRRFPETSDMESQMYTPVSGIEAFLREHPEKPFISCEYMHAMGNSIGGMFKYTDLAKREPRYQGGFIWDFVDQAISTANVFGEEYLAYGGDFGERPHDGNFSGDGIVDGHRRPYAKMQEVKFCYQNADIFVEEAGVRFVNRYLFTDLGEFDGLFLLEADGEEVLSIPFEVSLAPGGEVLAPMPETISEALKGYPGREMVLTASLRLKEDAAWAPKGYEIAFGQGRLSTAGQPDSVSLPSDRGETPAEEGRGEPGRKCVSFAMNRLFSSERASAAAGAAAAGEGGPAESGISDPWKAVEGILGDHPRLRLIRGGFNLGAVGEGFDVLFSGLMGNLVSFRAAGRELLTGAPPRPNFWRAPTDNDLANGQPARSGIWKLASEYAVHLPGDGWPRVSYDGESLEVSFRYGLPGAELPPFILSYRVTAEGLIRAALSFPGKEGLPPLPDFGLLLEVSPSLTEVRGYGLGPRENYCDRNMGARLGLFEGKVSEMQEPYLRPQETGNRTGVRQVSVTDPEGFGLRFFAEPAELPAFCGNPLAAGGMNFSALPWKPGQLENAAHAFELPRSVHTFVRLSALQMGVGGDDTWGARTHPEFLPRADRPLSFTVSFCACLPER